jgi:hypothetical protein
MAAELTRLTHKITIKLHLVAESCTICSSRSRRLVRKLLDTPARARVCVCYFKLDWRILSFSFNFLDSVKSRLGFILTYP